MAASSVGGSFLSASIASLYEKLASPELKDFFQRFKHGDRLQKKLDVTLKTLNEMLSDAEDGQSKDAEVKLWLDGLKDVVYRAEDLLDEISTDALQRRLEANSNTSKLKEYWNFFSTSESEKDMKSKFKSIAGTLESIAEEGRRSSLSIREGVFRKNLPPRLLTSSLTNDGYVYGRDNDKKLIIERLLSYGPSDFGICVISIVGMAGIGKTTLARLVYNDVNVERHFDVTAWACVSGEFDACKITKTILEEVTYSACDFLDLDLLQSRLEKSLKQKRFLIVLDDVWTMNNWEGLKRPFRSAAKGSKIIMTSRDNHVASIKGTVQTYYLKQLPDEDCWQLFTSHASLLAGENRDLEVIGRDIVKRCMGLPLVAKTLGVLLRRKRDANEWRNILKGNIWNFPKENGDFLSALQSSYFHLPPQLKRCFAYCSIFPKDYEFEKEKLVLLWMAEDLLPQNIKERTKSIEEAGKICFDHYLWWSFFQQSGGDKSCFVMHDLMNDLAQFISGEFCFRLEDNGTNKISERVRYLSYSEGNFDAIEKFKAIIGLKCVRTFLAFAIPPQFESCQLTEKMVRDLLLTQGRLRVLSLSHCFNITELHDSIGNLKHLRYLDVSHTKIQRLPESVSTLCNLQTLMLLNCRSLTKLPRNMGNLIKLRYLNIGGTALEEMPIQIGRLRSLQTLTHFIVGGYGGLRISELGLLSYLCGTLSILKLQNTVDAIDASASNLKDKYLEELLLEWSFNVDMQIVSDVLEKLQPHTNLKRLTIRFYGGKKFPDWLGNSSFSNMVFLHLSNCKHCQFLPPLGQLPSLKDLIIEGFDRVEEVGPEFYRMTSSAMIPFKTLKTLRFVGMLEWVKWISSGVEGGEFPCLQELHIQRCPKLIGNLPKHLTSLTKVEISESPKLAAVAPWTPISTIELQFDEDKAASKSVSHKTQIPNVTYEATTSKSFSHKTEIPNVTHEATTSKSFLHETEIRDITYGTPPQSPDKWMMTGAIPELQSSSDQVFPQQPDVQVMTTLKKEESLQSSDISQLKDLPKIQVIPELQSRDDEASSKISLHKMEIPNVTHESTSEFPSLKTEIPDFTYGAASPSLVERTATSYSQDKLEDPSSFESLKISDISELKDFPPRLHSLRIEECDTIESLPEEMTDSNCCLEDLYIISCSSLKSLPRGGLPSTLKTLYIRNCRKLELSLPSNTVHQYALLERLCIGSSCDSLKAFPLGFFPKLRSLCLLGFPNFESISIAEGLHKNLNSLDSLEIRDCPKLISFPKGGLPATNLTSIWISNCSNLKSLPEQMHTLLPSLQVLSISNCPILELFPEESLPSNLYFLCISSCNKLTPRVEWGMQTMASLGRFEIEGECRSVESFPEEGLLPDSLASLCINRLSNLKHLDYDGLQCLTSLETLEISCCNKLQSFPVEGLPTSLSSLIIKDCPLLKVRCQGGEGVDWPRIAHIPYIEIDEEVIS